jgi:hypothetical protein
MTRPSWPNDLKAAAYVILLVAIAIICSAQLPEPISAVRLLWP